MDGLKPVERELLSLVQSAGPNGQLYQSAPINGLIERFGTQEVKEALRSLIEAQRLQVSMTVDKGHLLTLPRAAMTDGTQLVLAVIQDAGSNGIDAVSVGTRTKLPRAEVLKSLQALIASGAIKETRNFVNRAQKIYMLATLEPSDRVTGGSFFTNRVLDTEFIIAARDVIHSRLKLQGGAMKVRDMKAALDAHSSTAQRHLSMKEVGVLARTLELDDLIMRAEPDTVAAAAGGMPPRSALYHDFSDVSYCLGSRSTGSASKEDWPPVEMAWAAAVPCTGCPHLDECDIVGGRGLINPSNCKYMTAWITRAIASHSQQSSQQQQASANAPRHLDGGPVRPPAPAPPIGKNIL